MIARFLLYIIISLLRLLSYEVDIPWTMISVLSSTRWSKAALEIRFIRPASLLVREDIFCYLIIIILILLLEVILIVLMIECLRALLRWFLIWRDISRIGELLCLIRRLHSFLVGGEDLGLLSDYGSNSMFFYFFLALFSATSHQRGIGVFGEREGDSGGSSYRSY